MQIRKLEETKKYLITYTVVGTGHLPLDMLRYATCWPSNSQDDWIGPHKREIEISTFSPIGKDMHTQNDDRQLKTFTAADRWASFGWLVK